ncbi:alanine racemase [Denitratisoma oestradiolicum]|uniref:Alanine racemase n=1 Tax=Denitratisoma oestradiolicum TaxID=311182 RepID=A0A6S6YQN1_9PROT|nr:alanine racemase [Denitratisoma oestradiolicum]TWO80190.1 alanine racemase [Denitratisoma oestradiolicum]CAB1370082.1 Alanine racemase [Denitratisoma oestradiolicum]
MTRPLRARIDLAALRHNYSVARQYGGATALWCVVKANGYGHGLFRVAHALSNLADGFALLELESAEALREAGLRQPLLMMEGFYSEDELPRFARHRLTPVLHSLAQVRWLVDSPMLDGLAEALPVYLKLNTGMNRLGLDQADFRQALAWLQASPRVAGITLMTHFADADEPAGITRQMACLADFRDGAAAGLPICLANSAALVRFPGARGGAGDWARPGIMLYGCSPCPAIHSAEALGLRPVMNLESQVLAVRELAPGDTVGYGSTFVASGPMRIGIIAGGYGDGYPRHAPTGTPVMVSGRRVPLVGRVSMDKICVDLSDIPAAQVGSPATLWGVGPAGHLPVEEVAAAAGTISYELLCALAARVAIQVED